MTEKIKQISESTLVPISLVLVFLGGAAWMTTINSKATATEGDVAEIKLNQKEYEKLARKIDERLSHIEGKLGINESITR